MAKRKMQPLRIPGLPESEPIADAGLQDRVYDQVRKIVATNSDSASTRQFRIGADLVIDVLQDDGSYKRFEVIANGTRLRDPESRDVWPFPLGAALVQDAVPRILAVADARRKRRATNEGRASEKDGER